MNGDAKCFEQCEFLHSVTVTEVLSPVGFGRCFWGSANQFSAKCALSSFYPTHRSCQAPRLRLFIELTSEYTPFLSRHKRCVSATPFSPHFDLPSPALPTIPEGNTFQIPEIICSQPSLLLGWHVRQGPGLQVSEHRLPREGL